MTPTAGRRPGKPVSPRRARAPKRESRAFNSGRPPKPDPDTIAQHAWSELSCRQCGSAPKSACIGDRDPSMSVCPERYADAAIQMRQAYNMKHPSWQALENQARAEIAAERGVDPATVGWREITGRVREQAARNRT